MDARASPKQPSAQPRPAAALAFDHFVALLQQALALAVLALLLLLDIGTFFIGHHDLQTMLSRELLERLLGRTFRDSVIRSSFIACMNPTERRHSQGSTTKPRAGLPARRDSPLPTRSSRGSLVSL